MLTNPNKNYLGLNKFSSRFGMLDRAAHEIYNMKYSGIEGDYQTALFPFPSPNGALNERLSSFGVGNPYLYERGIMGDYQTALFPYPASNAGMNAALSSFGKKKRKKSTGVRKRATKIEWTTEIVARAIERIRKNNTKDSKQIAGLIRKKYKDTRRRAPALLKKYPKKKYLKDIVKELKKKKRRKYPRSKRV